MGGWFSVCVVAALLMLWCVGCSEGTLNHDYRDALTKSILFFEGQRSGPLPASQRMTWRKDSALYDGHDIGVDLVGGYYDAGDNVKFNFPMAFTTTVLAWGVIEFGSVMGPDLVHTTEAIRWATDYLLKATSVPNTVYVQVGNPYKDHNCWERPEDMDTPRTPFAVDKNKPGSEVSGEIAAALAASSIVFKVSDPAYSQKLLERAKEVFHFADTYRGNYNESLGSWVCPFYCDWSGYEDELLWGASWLQKATGSSRYMNYVMKNMGLFESRKTNSLNDWYGEFGWDNKMGGLAVLRSIELHDETFIQKADQFMCNVLPDSPTRSVNYSRGGLMFKPVGSNMQNPTAISFLLVIYSRYLKATYRTVQCGFGVNATADRLEMLAKQQVDYILGSNPMGMSYMVGYGPNFPKKIHHRASSLPSVVTQPARLECQGGKKFFYSKGPNPNLLVGAVVGGPYINDSYPDSRVPFTQSEPTTYINAPLVGVLAHFTSYTKKPN
ncbi:hypothetical protein Syun_012664 [Stephania yunnanensis]|uniref:Endoglucanase n=1 Tax=Stephania yunnanensis TaxID=152371 RepID=A0AAP0K0N1_9MAGN